MIRQSPTRYFQYVPSFGRPPQGFANAPWIVQWRKPLRQECMNPRRYRWV